MRLLVTTIQSTLAVDLARRETRVLHRGLGSYFGLAATGDAIAVVYKDNFAGTLPKSSLADERGGLLLFDRGLRQVGTLQPDDFALRDAHGCLHVDGRLLVCCCCDDMIAEVDLRTRRWQRWRPDPASGDRDVHHFNTLRVDGDRLQVLAHNHGRSEIWEFDRATRRLLGRVAIGEQAHNIVDIDGTLHVCDSRNGRIVTTTGGAIATGQFPRGLVVDGDVIAVGLSENTTRDRRPTATAQVRFLDRRWRRITDLRLPGQGVTMELLVLDAGFDFDALPTLDEAEWHDAATEIDLAGGAAQRDLMRGHLVQPGWLLDSSGPAWTTEKFARLSFAADPDRPVLEIDLEHRRPGPLYVQPYIGSIEGPSLRLDRPGVRRARLPLPEGFRGEAEIGLSVSQLWRACDELPGTRDDRPRGIGVRAIRAVPATRDDAPAEEPPLPTREPWTPDPTTLTAPARARRRALLAAMPVGDPLSLLAWRHRPDGLPDASIDLLFADDLVAEYDDPRVLLHHAQRALRPDGLLVLTMPNAGSALHAAAGEPCGLHPRRFSVIDHDELLAALAARFDLVASHGVTAELPHALRRALPDDALAPLLSAYDAAPRHAAEVVLLARRRDPLLPPPALSGLDCGHAAIRWHGAWTDVDLPSGRAGRRGEAGSAFAVAFAGPAVTLWFWSHDWSGQASLVIDGEARDLDLYSPAPGTRRIRVAGLHAGLHQLVLRCTGGRRRESADAQVIFIRAAWDAAEEAPAEAPLAGDIGGASVAGIAAEREPALPLAEGDTVIEIDGDRLATLSRAVGAAGVVFLLHTDARRFAASLALGRRLGAHNVVAALVGEAPGAIAPDGLAAWLLQRVSGAPLLILPADAPTRIDDLAVPLRRRCPGLRLLLRTRRLDSMHEAQDVVGGLVRRQFFPLLPSPGAPPAPCDPAELCRALASPDAPREVAWASAEGDAAPPCFPRHGPGAIEAAGLMLPSERLVLYALTLGLGASRCLLLGAAGGSAVAAVAGAVADAGGGRVALFDPDDAYRPGGEPVPLLRIVDDTLEPLPAALEHLGGPIDLLFIDNTQEPLLLRLQLEQLRPRLAPAAVVVLHDGLHAGVRAGVDAVLAEHPEWFVDAGMLGTEPSVADGVVWGGLRVLRRAPGAIPGPGGSAFAPEVAIA